MRREIDALVAFPLRNPIRPLESDAAGFAIRRAVFGNYLIFYYVDEAEACIIVLRVRHAARSPDAL